MIRRDAVRLAAVATVAAVLTSGCGVLSGGLRGVDLPGGADLGDDPYSVVIEFADVVDLVPQSLVKVNDVPVGTVTDITVGPNWTANVTVMVNGDVPLPADAQARVRTTSLLGEKFVELLAPEEPGPAGSQLADGALIPLARTGRAAEVEEVLGALSMLLNGGGVAQIRTIATELNKALTGNEPEIRTLLGDLDTMVGALDSKKGEITRAIDEINRLAATLDDRKGQIETALDDLAPGLRELESQRGALVDMLKALDRLSGVATDVVEQSRDDLLADIEHLRPILRKLAESGSDLVNSLEFFLTPPFTDAAVDAFAGDYANLYVRADLDLGHILENLARSNQPLLGPDSPLSSLPPTSQLLGPLLGADGAGQAFPLPLPGQVEPAPTTGSQVPPAQRDEPEPEPEGGGLFDGLFGGGG
ncbi:MCE family protein [Actinomycetes bacterium KLBMP 9759]